MSRLVEIGPVLVVLKERLKIQKVYKDNEDGQWTISFRIAHLILRLR